MTGQQKSTAQPGAGCGCYAAYPVARHAQCYGHAGAQCMRAPSRQRRTPPQLTSPCGSKKLRICSSVALWSMLAAYTCMPAGSQGGSTNPRQARGRAASAAERRAGCHASNPPATQLPTSRCTCPNGLMSCMPTQQTTPGPHLCAMWGLLHRVGGVCTSRLGGASLLLGPVQAAGVQASAWEVQQVIWVILPAVYAASGSAAVHPAARQHARGARLCVLLHICRSRLATLLAQLLRMAATESV